MKKHHPRKLASQLRSGPEIGLLAPVPPSEHSPRVLRKTLQTSPLQTRTAQSRIPLLCPVALAIRWSVKVL